MTAAGQAAVRSRVGNRGLGGAGRQGEDGAGVRAGQPTVGQAGERGDRGRVGVQQQRSQPVAELLAVPDGVLLRPCEHRDGLGELAVDRQWAVRGQFGAQNVGQHQRVAGVGLLARQAVSVPVARHRHRVDREHLPAGRAQTRHQQAVRALDRYRMGCSALSPQSASTASKARRPLGSLGTLAQPRSAPVSSTTATS